MKEIIERSAEGVKRVVKIIQDMKTFSRIDRVELSDVDINEAIEIILGLMVNEYKYGIEIKKDYGQLPLVRCFGTKLSQVFMNLLINACQAVEGKGAIGIKTYKEKDMVYIEISDTGKGIPEDIKDRIFDPFFTTKPVGKGTGLGLSISHGIVTEHKGEIIVKNTPERGTTFIVKIPVDVEKFSV